MFLKSFSIPLNLLNSTKRYFATAPTIKPIFKQRPPQLLQRVLHIRKVSRTNSGGKVRSTSACVVVGDQNGSAGFGIGRGSDSSIAIQKATLKAKKNLTKFLRLDNRTIYSDINFKFHAVNVEMRTTKPGSGIVANLHVHEVCRCVGISDISVKIRGSNNPMNVIQATFAALASQKTPQDIAKMRGKKVHDLEMTYYGMDLPKY
ncbi:ribosomal protein S5, C-terminal domain-containing protein [Globomyces pollinis-pini]|nr:ribosomal protein S5, C-terminal domain-containing protein [Globomyces pollinis-pini]